LLYILAMKTFFGTPIRRNLIITSLIVSSAWSTRALAQSSHPDPNYSPANAKYLGVQSYIPVTTQKLAQPSLVYVDIAQQKLSPLSEKFLLQKWGWAVPTENEPKDAYFPETRMHSASFYGGNGMNGNIGDGRTSIRGDENFKGIGPTGMVNPHSEVGHTSGTLKIDHAIIEAIWSKLLDLELPYGANRVRGILGTGTIENRDGHPGQRVVIVRDDFLRPAHFITNETSSKVNRVEIDRERVRQAILNLPEALPHATNGIRAIDKATKLKLGLNEFVDRFAIQAAYMWSHSLYHGAMSPSNVTLEGAAADFGTFQALAGYPSVQLLSDCAPNGDYSEELQVLKEFHSELINNSPADWIQAIGTLDSWANRFKKTYELNVEKQMLSLSGAFLELIDPLAHSNESRELAHLLIQIAKAGNEEVIQTWVKPLPFETGTYSLSRILEKLAHSPLNESELQVSLKSEIADSNLRLALSKSYLAYYQKMNALAEASGISAISAQKYRIHASQIRNRKMTEVFRNAQLQQQLNAVVQDYAKNSDAKLVRQFIEQKVNASRRNFKDAAPFTVVTQQSFDEKTGEIVREVFDAKSGILNEIRSSELTPLEKVLKRETSGPRGLRCENLFRAI
jgi:hypothetical protein